MNLNPIQTTQRRAFTIVEILVVIAILAVLASLTLIGLKTAKIAAAKTGSINNLRNIGAGVGSWTMDHGGFEPWFYANGTGDYPHETGGSSDFQPGNPAKALYDTDEPDEGYIRDHSVFFTPLNKEKAPQKSEYDPRVNGKLWGTYTWFHPFVDLRGRTGRQLNLLGGPGTVNNPGKVNPAISGEFLMSESYYRGSPTYGKEIYHALMRDGSVSYVGDSKERWLAWKTGEKGK